jgi:hypothetical protein
MSNGRIVSVAAAAAAAAVAPLAVSATHGGGAVSTMRRPRALSVKEMRRAVSSLKSWFVHLRKYESWTIRRESTGDGGIITNRIQAWHRFSKYTYVNKRVPSPPFACPDVANSRATSKRTTTVVTGGVVRGAAACSNCLALFSKRHRPIDEDEGAPLFASSFCRELCRVFYRLTVAAASTAAIATETDAAIATYTNSTAAIGVGTIGVEPGYDVPPHRRPRLRQKKESHSLLYRWTARSSRCSSRN